MRILHVSDTHLGAMPGGTLLRYRDIFEAFKETVDIAIRERVDVYLHTGDFFDRAHVPAEAYIVARNQLKRLVDSGIKVVIVAGQHDLPRRYQVSPLEVLRVLEVANYVVIQSVERIKLDIDGHELEIVAVPYSCRDEISRYRPFSKKSILAAHLLLKELGIPNFDASLNDIPRGFSYVALGDYHKKKILRLPSGEPVVYPGATEVLRRDEWEEDGKAVALVDLDGDEPVIQFIKLETVRPWIVVETSDVRQAIEVVEKRAKEIRSRGLKAPIASIKIVANYVDKGGIQLLLKALSDLVDRGLLAYYLQPIVEKNDIPSIEIAARSEVAKIDVEKMIESIVGSKRFAEMLYELVKEPREAVAEKIAQSLLEDQQLLEEVEKALVKTLNMSRLQSQAVSRSSSRGRGLEAFLR